MFQQEFIMIPFNKYHNLLNQNFELKNKLGIFDDNNTQEPLTFELITIQSLQIEIVNLEEENKTLNKRILQLENSNIQLKNTIYKQNEHIIEIKAENVELKAEIVELKAEIVELKAENVELKAEIVELKAEIVELKAENVEIKQILNNFTEKEHMQKIIMAVQDLNANFSLEKYIKNSKLYILRDNRNNTCHYIDDKNDSDFIKMKKYEYIINKLSTINTTIKRKIESQYGRDIIQKIIDYVKPFLTVDVIMDDDITEEELNNELTFFWE
jgi:chromosome segregation ATPase